MKKILSTLLVAAMLLSLVIVVAVPASAVDGIWDSMGTATQYAEDYDGLPNSRPGYEYTEEGLHMIPAEWENQTPFGTLQTKEKINLKDGVYMLVRVDNFTYAADKWFNINIWDSVNLSPGSQDTGAGVQTLIRPGNAGAEGQPGTISGISWYTGGFTGAGSSNMAADAVKADEDGKPLMALTVTWNGSSYAVDINGAAAPQAVIDYMNTKWNGNDSEAYIGFSLQNANKNGTVEATILKFGTTAADATVPMGDDSKEPEEFNHVPAELMDPSNIPAGQPAILMNGSAAESHTMTKPSSAVGTTLSINEDYSVHCKSEKAGADAGYWAVDYEVSYSIEDFPVFVTLTRNLCTCGEDECYALESCNVYLCTGEVLQPTDSCQIKELDMSYDPIVVDGDFYLMFFTDMSDEYAPFEATGRINGCRIDFAGIDIQTPGKNEFDVCWSGFFRTAEEAEAYVNAYVGIADEDTETEPTVDTTETEPTVDTTETEPTVVTTETEPTDVTTEDKGEATTEKKTDNKTEDKTDAPADEEEGGCGSVVGFGAIAIVAVAAVAGMVSFKKKD